jgi:hypothetical protein
MLQQVKHIMLKKNPTKQAKPKNRGLPTESVSDEIIEVIIGYHHCQSVLLPKW